MGIFIKSMFIYIHVCRRITMIFDRINRRKGWHISYAFLEKICCRDYNKPVKIPGVIQGDQVKNIPIVKLAIE